MEPESTPNEPVGRSDHVPDIDDLGSEFQKLTERQQKFLLSYLKHFSPARAFREAGLRVRKKDTIRGAARLLLTHPTISAIVARHRAKLMDQLQMDAQQTLQHFQYVYLEAMRDKDYPSAIAALDKIAKHFGLYKEHNKQKHYSPDDLEKIRLELESAGFDFRRKALDFPSEN